MTDPLDTPATSDSAAAVFARARPQLRALAHRLLGSAADADDVVQDAWLRFERVDPATIDRPGAWLRTVVTRLCLDELRSRRRRPAPVDLEPAAPADLPPAAEPEDTALVADSVTRAMLVVLDRLEPDERIAFVLHDVFAVPFADIGPLVGRSASTTKKLASRARAKVRAGRAASSADARHARVVVERFLRAAAAGDLGALIEVLAPDVVRRSDVQALPPGAAAVVRGAHAVALGAMAFGHRARDAEVALVDGAIGAVVVSGGRLRFALRFTIAGDRIAAYDVIADPARLAAIDLRVLDA